MEIGKYNKLKIARLTEFGFFLEDKEGDEVLLPNAYISDEMKIDDEIEVFIFKDSEDRIVASTKKPLITLNEFAVLTANDVNTFGAFMEWGYPKELLVPYSEQRTNFRIGEQYLVYLLKDSKTNRLIGSNRAERFLDDDLSQIEEGQKVKILVYDEIEFGYQAIIENKFKGLIFHSDIHKEIKIGDYIDAYIKTIREDGKIDLALEPIGYRNSIDKTTDQILDAIKKHGGELMLNDKSPADEVKSELGMSKKAFKRGIGNLYKQKQIDFIEGGIKLISED
jgi:predicted RNA-binding protein (virulence factor B family)